MSEIDLGTPSFNLVLFQPEIPQNTGNIGRSCVAVNAKLWIVRPMGFRLDEKLVQRAGLNYWQFLDMQVVDTWAEMIDLMDLQRTWFFTKFAQQLHTQARYRVGDWLVFGSESNGLPPSVREQYLSHCVRLPMTGPVRSLNLSVSVGIGLYEAYRQCSLPTQSSLPMH